MSHRIFIVAALAVCTAGCVTTGTDTINFQAKSYQQAMMRDGDAVITSRGRSSVVSVRSATHLVGDKPIFIIGIQNVSRIPLDFRVSEVTAGQIVGGATNAMRVYTYDELVSQEQTAQVGRAILVGVLGGLNSAIVSSDPDQQAIANAQYAQLAAANAAQGQQNMAELEQLAIKDHTLLPGENYAGKLYLESPANTESGQKSYFVNIKVGPDHHEFQITQAPAAR